jgi:hypothetical protein
MLARPVIAKGKTSSRPCIVSGMKGPDRHDAPYQIKHIAHPFSVAPRRMQGRGYGGASKIM